ncbi:MAG: hypothetical protein ABI806_06755 [Candidatus Solibacter sp.]
MRLAKLIFTLQCVAAAQGVIDRVAVVVGNQVITDTEVRAEVRLTQFFNGQPPNLSADARRQAAERLVDQHLIKVEMETGGYKASADSDAEPLLRQFRQRNYPNDAAYRALLEKYGLSEDDVKRHLLWQVAALRFAEQRFRMANPPLPSQAADRLVDRTQPALSKEEEEDEMDAWLKQARSGVRIQFKKEAFQ